MDVYTIDKARVRASFDRAATRYDAAAILQNQVRLAMLQRLDLIKISPQMILDAGCGTGRGSFALQKRFKKAQVISLDFSMAMLNNMHTQQSFVSKVFGEKNLVCADIEQLPVADNGIDFFWTNLALQWCNDLDKTFSEVMRILQPDGLFMFSTFGPDTLKELRVASGNEETHVSRFIDMHDIGDALTRAGFNAPVLDVEHYTLTYDNVKGVMMDLKAIGANNATGGRAKTLKGKGFLKHLTAQYEQFRQQDGKLPATFEVVFGHAWAPASKLNINLEQGVAPINFRPRN